MTYTIQLALNPEQFSRIKNDINGNPRYVIHFLAVCPESIKNNDSLWVSEKYQLTIGLMNKIGGRKYHNKSFGGGISFRSYNLEETILAIQKVISK